MCSCCKFSILKIKGSGKNCDTKSLSNLMNSIKEATLDPKTYLVSS